MGNQIIWVTSDDTVIFVSKKGWEKLKAIPQNTEIIMDSDDCLSPVDMMLTALDRKHRDEVVEILKKHGYIEATDE